LWLTAKTTTNGGHPLIKLLERNYNIHTAIQSVYYLFTSICVSYVHMDTKCIFTDVWHMMLTVLVTRIIYQTGKK